MHKTIMDTAIKRGLYALKAAEATREFIGNKITSKIAKSKPVPDVEERVIPPEKREEVSNELRQLL